MRRILSAIGSPIPMLKSAALAAAAVCFAAVPALAETSGGWGDWWLPPDRSAHGWAMDRLFVWIFWITTITFILVQATLVVFLIKYRGRPGRQKAHFTHGNTRLEMCWTLAPAVILAMLALFSKRVWDDFRYSPSNDDPRRTTVLVIGEQFKWNIIHPGPDGKLGRYLKWPRPTDARWQNPDGSGKDFTFQNTKGPAELGYTDAVKAINAYIDQYNKLGKDFEDPDGKDDDWGRNPGRELIIPKDRPVEIQLSSKDVIHSFYLPNFRVKLDAVPGMRGGFCFTATKTSTEREQASRREYTLDELATALKSRDNADLTIAVGEGMPSTQKDRTGWRFVDLKDAKDPAKPSTIIRDRAPLPTDPERLTATLAKLRDNGVAKVTVYKPGEWELVCAELCGQGHYTMRGVVRVVDSAEFDGLKLDDTAENKLKRSGRSVASAGSVATFAGSSAPSGTP